MKNHSVSCIEDKDNQNLIDYQNNDKNVYDMQISISKKSTDQINKLFQKSNNDIKKFILNMINRDDLISAIIQDEDMNQFLENFTTSSNVQKFQKYSKSSTDSEIQNDSKIDKFPDWIVKSFKDPNFKIDENDRNEYFIDILVYILTNLCGCRVKVLQTDLHDKVHSVIYIRLMPETLQYQAAKFQIPLHLDFSDKYIQNARIQMKEQIDNDKAKYDKVIKMTSKINELNDQKDVKNEGQNNFINLQPQTTLSNIEINKSYEFIEKNFLCFPFSKNNNIISLNQFFNISQNNNEINKEKSQFSKQIFQIIPEELYTNLKKIIFENILGLSNKQILRSKSQNPKDINAIFSDLNGFSFGVCDDTEKDKFFSQNDRIFILNKIINEQIDVEYLQENKYINGQSSIHHNNDLKIIDKKIANISQFYKQFTNQDLIMINQQYGSEIAHQFGFLNNYTKNLRIIAIISFIYQITFITQEIYNYNYQLGKIFRGLSLLRLIISFIQSFIVLIFGAFLIRDNENNQKELNQAFGQQNLEFWNKGTEISNQKNPVQQDPLKDAYVKHEENYSLNIQRQLTYFIQYGLIIIMVYCNIQILKIKNDQLIQQGQTRDLYFQQLSILCGISASLSIKVFEFFYKFLTYQTTKYSNQKQQDKKQETIALKTFIFNQCNTLFVYFQISFFKRYNESCIKKNILLFKGKETQYNSCYQELSNQLMIQSIVFFLMNFVELNLPLIKNYVQELFNKKSIDQNLTQKILLNDIDKDEFCNEISNEQMEMIIQFAIIFTFGATYPLSFVLAQFNNLFELRVDITKIVKFSNRGFCNKKYNIGIQNDIMKFILCIAVLSKLGFHMFEAQMLNQEVKDIENIIISESIFMNQYNYLQSTNKESEPLDILNFDTEQLILQFIILQNLMLIIIYLILNNNENQNIKRWKNKDDLRLQDQRNNSVDNKKNNGLGQVRKGSKEYVNILINNQ